MFFESFFSFEKLSYFYLLSVLLLFSYVRLLSDALLVKTSGILNNFPEFGDDICSSSQFCSDGNIFLNDILEIIFYFCYLLLSLLLLLLAMLQLCFFLPCFVKLLLYLFAPLDEYAFTLYLFQQLILPFIELLMKNTYLCLELLYVVKQLLVSILELG
jgi:hypothetical protein